MRKLMKIIVVFLFATVVITSCSSNSNSEKSAYELMEIAFEGNPDKSEIQPILEGAMTKHGLEITEENLKKAASVLVTAKKNSKKGITEMQLLKHIYENGAKELSFPDQAGISFTLLESEK